MPVVTRRELLEAGVHFGHQTRRWNPKMGRYLYGERSGIYIIDLEKSLTGLEEAHAFASDLGRRGGIILFIGTKKQTQEVISDHATRVGMPYVNNRWLGGMLTNFTTISKRLGRLRELREMDRSGATAYLPKKEVIRLHREQDKLERNLGGLQELERLPDAVFVVDTKKEHIAVNEARKLGLPVIAIVDTNCDPDEVDYVIPGNDDAIRAVTLVTRVIADAIDQGRGMSKDKLIEKAVGPPASQVFEPDAPAPAGSTVDTAEPEPEIAAEPQDATDQQPETAGEPEVVAETTQASDAGSAPAEPGATA
jgi:small subunit ribosomal protein S2